MIYLWGDKAMEWFEKLNEALEYLEKNLDSEINYEKVAKIAGCSTYHFQRMFSYVANISLAEYIRKRKMTLAAFDIQSSNEKIIDIALKYGYESPTAFNRAFQNIHGISPVAARNQNINLKAFPRISFQLTIKGGCEMNYKIVTKEKFRIVGVKRFFDITGEEGFTQIPLFWQEITQKGLIPHIAALIDGEPSGILGVSTEMENFEYFIAAPSSKDVPEGMVEYEVPASTYAVFECTGSIATNALQDLERRIMTEWLPTSGYEYSNGADIEVYPAGNQFSENYTTQVWLPIKKKTGGA